MMLFQFVVIFYVTSAYVNILPEMTSISFLQISMVIEHNIRVFQSHIEPFIFEPRFVKLT